MLIRWLTQMVQSGTLIKRQTNQGWINRAGPIKKRTETSLRNPNLSLCFQTLSNKSNATFLLLSSLNKMNYSPWDSWFPTKTRTSATVRTRDRGTQRSRMAGVDVLRSPEPERYRPYNMSTINRYYNNHKDQIMMVSIVIRHIKMD